MVSSTHIPKNRREKQRRHAQTMKVLINLMKLLGKGRCKHPSSLTGINSVIVLSGMLCGVYSPLWNLSNKKRSETFFSVSTIFPWNT